MNIKMKIFNYFLLLSIIWIYGIVIGTYKITPYSQIKYIQDIIQPDSNSPYLAKNRYSDTSSKVYANIQKDLPTGVFLTYGQSNSLSNGQIGYNVNHSVYQFFDDSCYIYSDPVLGSNKSNKVNNYGSVWGMVGDGLIEGGHFDQVIFSNCGWGGATISELSEGELYNYIKSNFFKLKNNFGKVDGILFHQGEKNHSSTLEGNKNYYAVFEKFWENLKKDQINTSLFLSQASYCDNNVDNDLLNIQEKLIIDLNNIYRGLNTDLLIDSKYRLLDGCHFSMEGFTAFSKMWLTSIINPSEI